MNNDQLLAQLDREAKPLKTQIDLGEALARLKTNRDFNKVVIAGYLQAEAIRLVHLKADENAPQSKVLRDIDAIGSFGSYLNTIRVQSEIAKKQLADNDATREDVLKNGDE